MIVKCASCQTRFKIGDDKVTDKGVKVRCTKCSTVFTVKKEDSDAPPAADPAKPAKPAAAAPTPGKSSKTVAPFKTSLTSATQLKASAAATTPLSALLGADLVAKPLAVPPASTPAPPPPPPSDDPFAAFMGSPPPAPTNGAGLMPGEFALSGGPATPSPPAPAAGFVGTSAEDLLGLGSSWPAPPPPGPASPGPAVPPKAPDPFEAALDPLGGILPAPSAAMPDPFANLPADPFGDLPPSAAPTPPVPPTVASFGAEFDAGSFDPLAGLSLNPASVGAEPSHEPELGSASPSDLFDVPTRAAPPPAPAPRPDDSGLPEPSSPSATPLGRIGVVKEKVRQEPREQPVVSAAEDKPLVARLFNALAGASVVVLALLAFVAYRNGGRLNLQDPLSAAFTAFGFSRPVPPSLSLPTQIASSGFYPTLHGDPVLFVRGEVKNLTPKAAEVGLKLDVIVDGHVVATADGAPGAVPTPEDLYGLKGPADVKALRERLAAAPPVPIAPGKSAEFVLVTAELPEGIRSGIERADLVVAARPRNAMAVPRSPPPPAPSPLAPKSSAAPAPAPPPVVAAPKPSAAVAVTPPPASAPKPSPAAAATAAQTPVPAPTH